MLRLDQTITYHIRILAKKYHQWAKRNFSEDHEEPPPPLQVLQCNISPSFASDQWSGSNETTINTISKYFWAILVSQLIWVDFYNFPLLIIKRMFILATSPRALTLLWMSEYKMMLSMSRFIKHFLKPYVNFNIYIFFISNLHSFVKFNYFQLRWRKENWV